MHGETPQLEIEARAPDAATPETAAAALVGAVPPDALATGHFDVVVLVAGVSYTVSVAHTAAVKKRRKRRARVTPTTGPEDDDLPEAIRGGTRAVKIVYRVIRDLRAGVGGRDRCVFPKEIAVEDEKQRPGEGLSIHTVGHAITVLNRAKVIVRMRLLGWRLSTPSDSASGTPTDSEKLPGAAPSAEPEGDTFSVPSSALFRTADPEPSQRAEGGVNSDKYTE